MAIQQSEQGGMSPETVEFRGRVKWFNATKGYGFLTVDPGGADAFLHVTILRQVGHEDIAPGVTLGCHATRGPKGLQIMRIVSVDLSTAGPMPRADAGAVPSADDDTGDDFEPGQVKWYNAERGYGFVCPVSSGKDVFVHAATLRKNGIEGLTPGQNVRVRVAQGPKGLQVSDIRVA